MIRIIRVGFYGVTRRPRENFSELLGGRWQQPLGTELYTQLYFRQGLATFTR